uniref:Cytochrome P450 n=1 Tax=Moniliophthora roreri TaxID=221103 RepID=A0A0W0F3U8_MONRR
MTDSLLAFSVLFLLAFAISWSKRPGTKKYDLPLPPGPKPTFIVGNLFDLPSQKLWETLTKWQAAYGDLLHFETVGQHTFVLNTRELVKEFFEKRSRIYSDRPYFTMVEHIGWLESTFMQYGDQWRAHRRLWQKGFRHDASLEHLPIQAKKVREFLANMLHQPEDFMNHTRTLAAAVIMAIVYGHDVAPTNDHFVEIAEKAVATLAQTATSSVAFAMNLFPIIRFLPGWLPGCKFQERARESRVLHREMLNVPFESVKKDMAADVAKPSVLVKFLEEHNIKGGDSLQEKYIKRVVATAYGAGAESTASFVETFFLAMTLHPSVQENAQQEVDRILGKNRLPTFEDRVNLPYVEAVYRETLRWSPIVPLAVPHRAVTDDIIDGSTIIANVWAITRDTDSYPEPESFIPERFLKEDGTLKDDDMSIVFGLGRRICPGRHVAKATSWLAMVSLLAVFDVRKTGDTEQSFEFDKLFSDGLVQ